MDPENQYAVNFARKAAENKQGQDYKSLSGLMCWDAVKFCALRSGIIDKNQYDRIMGQRDMVRKSSPALARPQTIASLSPGQVLGFFVFEGDPKQERMIHCMLSLGQGKAVGNKNDCVGIGHSVGWEVLDLKDLSWEGDQLTCPVGKDGGGKEVRRNAICRYQWISFLRFL